VKTRLIDANALYERIKADEELARDRVIDTPNSFPNGQINPSAIRYMAQLNERTRFKEMVYDAPTIEEPKWIPCSERLPEEDTEVLISYRYKEGEGDTDHVNIDITSYGTTCFGGREIHTLKEWRQPFDYFHANYEVIAWMPLPEPWKGDYGK
jgi:hypothetical protein